ncbi:MAG: hypothetical protein AAF371_16160 [Pseudomonadota bacterium]
MVDLKIPDYEFYARPVKCGDLPVYAAPSIFGRLLGKADAAEEAPALVPLFRRGGERIVAPGSAGGSALKTLARKAMSSGAAATA